MTHPERKTIGFSTAEVEAIEQLVEDPSSSNLLVYGSLSGTGRPTSDEEATVASFSDAVRRLTQLGLVQVRRARREMRYRQLALASPLFEDKDVIAMGHSTMRALDASLPTSKSATRRHA